MKRYHVKPTAIKTVCSPTIPLLLFFFCVVLFITATEADEALKSRSPVVPTANGDWPQAFFNTAHTGYNRYETQLNRNNVPNLTQLWASQVGVGMLYSSPVIFGGKAYIVSGDGHLYALDALTGATVWVSEEGGLSTLNSAAVGRGLVFISVSGISAYDANTGRVIWHALDQQYVRASQTLSGNVLYVATNEGQVYALDASTGTVLWTTIGGCCIFDSAPTVSGGRLFQNAGNSVTAYDARTGDQLWQKTYAISGTLTAARGKLFVPAAPNIVALDQATGAVVWRTPRDTLMSGAPAVAGDLLFIPSGAGLHAFDVDTGTLVWTAPAYNIWSPAVANGVVYASNSSGEWDVFDARDGTELWSVTISGSCGGQCTNATAVVVNGILYLPGPDNFLRAYSVPSR